MPLTSQPPRCYVSDVVTAAGKFREAMRDCERMNDIAAACRDDGMLCAATYVLALPPVHFCNILSRYFRASVLSAGGMWDLELEQLRQLFSLNLQPPRCFISHASQSIAFVGVSAAFSRAFPDRSCSVGGCGAAEEWGSGGGTARARCRGSWHAVSGSVILMPCAAAMSRHGVEACDV